MNTDPQSMIDFLRDELKAMRQCKESILIEVAEMEIALHDALSDGRHESYARFESAFRRFRFELTSPDLDAYNAACARARERKKG